MNQFSKSGFPQFDPSQMDPKLLMELSRLVQNLPPEQVQKMQSLMHNMMAGLDVKREMEEFEKSLPPGFREKLMTLMGGSTGPGSFGQDSKIIEVPSSAASSASSQSNMNEDKMNLREARLTILRAVSDGRIPPEEAEKLLFSA